MAWGLIAAGAFTLSVRVAFALAAALLLGGCGYCIVQGRRAFAEKHSPIRRSLNRGFLLVTMLEGIAAAGVIAAIEKADRPDLLPIGIGLVIGLHFLALAKVFGTPVYYVTGAAIVLWSGVSWVAFRGNSLTVAAGLGIGAILWATSTYNLFGVLAARTATDVDR
jgi:hypothetical protein